ncbi:adenosylcobinamide-GDP ribazoletransferase [Paenibacillus sp. IB182496]|uniref:Adenosylcobinamide-GDP ribazoletransferase n=2 Tax=Paenibacillus sabuli TaxID=2772509 RepID=A0A927BW14_9BACL|nr:adenosylcobinamide-GDP ribazoletransferase [Paenibacillus sabuli]
MVNRMGRWLHALGAAVQFLTVVPLPFRPVFDERTAARSLVFFPWAGALIGAATAAAAILLPHVLPPLPAAALVLILSTAMTGALHLDGWMDTADGVLSRRPRARMLEIMKDSRVGAMGVAAAVLLLLLKWSLLAALLEQPIGAPGAVHLAAVFVWSRSAMALGVAAWPHARGSEGLAALYARASGKHALLALLAGALLVGAAYMLVGLPPLAALGYTLVGLALATAAASALALWLKARLGGLTGDTYGAMNEAAEAALLLALVAVPAS